MTHIRCVIGFGSFTDQELMGTTGAVLKGLPGNKAFSNPPPELAQLQPAADDMTAAMALQIHGGRAATAEKKKKRAALIAILRTLARYVEANCGNDEATLLTSGFDIVPRKGASSPLEKPTILIVKNGHGGELVAVVRKTHRAQSYQAETSAVGPTGPGPWQPAGVFTTSRSMRIPGLTAGTNYAIHVRAVGGSTGYSDWSDPVVHMCM